LKRFRFRLEQVLRIRRLQEDAARGALMRAHRSAGIAADRVNARIEDYAAAVRPSGTQTLETFNRLQAHLDNAARAVAVARTGYTQALAVVDERRAEWAAARQRVAALERLETRRHDEYTIEVGRVEDRLVDDLVVARHSRGAHL
jgi:flagellar FliJ protein